MIAGDGQRSKSGRGMYAAGSVEAGGEWRGKAGRCVRAMGGSGRGHVGNG